MQSIPWKVLKERFPKKCFNVLDMAAGTGDIAHRLQHMANLHNLNVSITLADPNPSMLAEAKRRPHPKAWRFADEDAAHIKTLKPNTFHLYTIAFGLRNIEHKVKALGEAYRLLKPGGLFYCLEFTQPPSPLWKFFFNAYLKTWVPFLAQAMAKKPAPYRYLTNSIQAFPKAPIVQEMIENVGFMETGFSLVSGGVTAIHWGQKPSAP